MLGPTDTHLLTTLPVQTKDQKISCKYPPPSFLPTTVRLASFPGSQPSAQSLAVWRVGPGNRCPFFANSWETGLSNFSSFSSLLFQSKSWQKAKGMILKSCRVRYRDPLDKASEKQFIVNDDNGTHILGLELNLYVYKTLYIYAPPLPFWKRERTMCVLPLPLASLTM